MEKPSNDDQDVMNRILMHGMHEETVFYSRINFFTLIEALLFTSLLSAGGLKAENAAIAAICAAVGIVVTVIWTIVQVDKYKMFKAVSDRLVRDVPDFSKTLDILKNDYGGDFQSTRMLVWFPPTVCGIAWLVLLFVAAVRLVVQW